ncbi:MAG: hypothetical protein ACFFDK_15985 [Promethearchaeota archaeon]
MDCLDEILIYYENRENQKSRAIKIWINHILVDLMGDLEEKNPENYLRVRNCLLLLVNLFFDIDYPDRYHSQGVPIHKITKKERIKYIDILKSEINNFN